jgi:hypothetical protein
MPNATLEKLAEAVAYNGLHKPGSLTLLAFVARTNAYNWDHYSTDRPQG